MWVTLVHSGAIARGRPTAAVVDVYRGRRGRKPSIIAAGPDGALWFTRAGDDRIGRITTDGELECVRTAQRQCTVRHRRGPDGALWFTAMTIGRRSAGSASTARSPTMAAPGGDAVDDHHRARRRAVVHAERRPTRSAGSSPSGNLTIRARCRPRGAGPVRHRGARTTTRCWFTAILADKIGRIPTDDAIQELDLPGKPHAVVAEPRRACG